MTDDGDERVGPPEEDWMAEPGASVSHIDKSVDEIRDEKDLIDALVIIKSLIENCPDSQVAQEITTGDIRELFEEHGLADELIEKLRTIRGSRVREELGPPEDE